MGLWRRRLRWHCDGSPLELLAVLATVLGGCADAPKYLGVSVPRFDAPPAAWPERFSFPDWIARHLEQRFGADAATAADALNLPGPVYLRARTSRTHLQAQLAAQGITTAPGQWAPQALRVTSSRPNLYGLPPSFLGAFEVQDEGSQLLGHLLDAQPGEQILDLCAGAGGKTLQLASQVGAEGVIHACDIDAQRLERLRNRALRAQANVHIHGAQPPASRTFPKVLVDAPCSELGVLRRGPDVRWRLSETLPHACAALQRSLIDKAVVHLEPGGLLVYATCTLTSVENEEMVDWALARHAHLSLVRPSLPASLLDARGCLVLAPHLHGTDGFFGAVFRLRNSPSASTC